MPTPKLVQRAAQPYVAIRAEIAPDELAATIDRSFGRLFAWLSQRGMKPAGAPFVKYNLIDMARLFELDLGVPLATPVEPSEDVQVGTLPAGQYAVVIHQGHYNGLRDATAALLQAATKLNIQWDVEPTPRGERFVARLETYLTDPSKERDPSRWQTEIAIKTRGDHTP